LVEIFFQSEKEGIELCTYFLFFNVLFLFLFYRQFSTLFLFFSRFQSRIFLSATTSTASKQRKDEGTRKSSQNDRSLEERPTFNHWRNHTSITN